MASPVLLSLSDVCVFSVCSLLSLVVGVGVALRGGSQSTTREYFLGGQKQSIFPAAMSLVVSFQSSVLILGIPTEVYLHGAMFAVRVFGMCAVIPVFVKIAVPLFYNLRLTSIYEYFGGRFPTMKVRFIMVGFGVLFNTCYSGLVLLGPAIVLQPMLGVPDWVIILIMSALAVAYTSAGGIKAVLWTDVFQSVVMVAGMLAVIIRCTMATGGPATVIEIAARHGRLELFDFNPDPTIRHTFWTLNIGIAFTMLNIPFSQQTVQRVNSLPSLRHAKGLALLCIPIYYVFILLAVACGIVVFAYYQSVGCDPIAAGMVSNPNEILVRTMHDVFHTVPGVTGLFLSALLSASLSTVSSCLNGLAAITWEDFLKLRWGNRLSDKQATCWSKVSVVAAGLLATVFALMLRFSQGNLVQMFLSIMGSLSGPTVGVFLLSIFYKKTSTIGVYAGTLAGSVMSLWLLIGFSFSPTLPKTPWLPLGATDQCTLADTNSSTTIGLNVTNTTDQETLNNTTTASRTDSTRDPEGFDILYSLSYMYFSAVTTLITVGVGAIVSRISYSRSTTPVPPDDYVMTLREFCSCSGTRRQRVRAQQGSYVITQQNMAADTEMQLQAEHLIHVNEAPVAGHFI